MTLHGLVQSEFETEVVASPYGEWYDKDAYQRAGEKWNRRADNGRSDFPEYGDRSNNGKT